MKNYYEILGVSFGATTTEIRNAYRKLVQQFHPDINPDPHALDRIKEINDAYDTLSDPAKRRAYDERLSNPYAYVPEEPQTPTHRDPKYRKQSGQRVKPDSYSPYELMAMYLKYIRWICAGCFAYTFLLGVDFTVPRRESVEQIKEVHRVYTVSRYGRSSYSHDVMILNSGLEVSLYDYSIKVFSNEQSAIVRYTPVFRHVMSVAPLSTGELVKAGNAYASLWFVPALLFVCSGLGLFLKGVEMPFNFGIISTVLFFITLYLF